MSKRKHPPEEKLRELYLIDKLSATKIAEQYNMSKTRVCGALHKFNIPIRKRVGKNHPNWKGGRVIKTGYVAIWNPKHHRANNVGYVFEHVLIMEKHLNRHIEREEHIHHIDFDKQNNEISNLWIASNSAHHIAQNSIFKLIKSLLEQEAIEFDTEKGIYVNYKQRGHGECG